MNANKPEKKAEAKMPRADLIEADLVSSEIWPEASKPVIENAATRKLRIQFHPAGAPVPLFCEVNTSFALLNPYVMWALTGNHVKFKIKSTAIKNMLPLNTQLYDF